GRLPRVHRGVHPHRRLRWARRQRGDHDEADSTRRHGAAGPNRVRRSDLTGDVRDPGGAAGTTAHGAEPTGEGRMSALTASGTPAPSTRRRRRKTNGTKVTRYVIL